MAVSMIVASVRSSMPSVSSIRFHAPDDAVVTKYDREHLLTYARMLDAADTGICWREAAAAILGCDVVHDAASAEACWTSHLARARWITREGLAQVVARTSD
jgi:hypothetical protein